MAERYAVAAFAFMAAATWLGVGVVRGLLCLGVAALAAGAMGLQQRRSGVRARATTRRRPEPRRRPAERRPQRSGLYDSDREGWDWPTADGSAW